MDSLGFPWGLTITLIVIAVLLLITIIVLLLVLGRRSDVIPITGISNFGLTFSGAQQVPVVNTSGTGSGMVSYNSNTKTLTYDITFTGLSSPFLSAHFHTGATGVNGDIVKDITSNEVSINIPNTAGRIQGTWSSTDANQPLTDSLINVLMNNGLYINIHSTTYPNGEIRAQVNKLLLV